MKTTTTLLRKLGLIVLFSLITHLAYSEDFYTYKGATATINPDPAGLAGLTGFKWILIAAPAGVTTGTAINPDDTQSTLTYNFPVAGSYTLRLSVKSGVGGCWSDETGQDITIYSLPTFTIGVTPATTQYCVNNVPTSDVTLTAATVIEGGLTPPIPIALAEWHKTLLADGVTTGGTAGPTTGATYDVKPTVVGDHFYVAIGQYTVPAGTLISAAGAPVKSNTATITVSPLPTTPTIKPVVTN